VQNPFAALWRAPVSSTVTQAAPARPARNTSRASPEAHFARIRAGRVESVETSALHLDVLRDLKRINAHIAAAAYPVLEKLGELLPSRLRRDGDAEDISPSAAEVRDR
jgi:hypothetical protein